MQFNRDIRPILADNCFQCHGPDKNQRKADLRFDREEDAFADLGGERALVPGSLEKSMLYQRIISDKKFRKMPPAKTGKKLTKEQIEIISRWIQQGAKWQKHWSLITPTRPAIPTVEPTVAIENPIDAFLYSRMKDAGVNFAPAADRRTLIRRLYFDLTGLPPSPEEVIAFEKDDSPHAWEHLVDRLLDSPHFGERMAAYWLDVVRFADTNGIHGDNHREIAPYRDYVIDAFNSNMPFDQFTTEQLAGDLLPNPTPEQKIASGFNRLLMTTREGGAQAKEYLAKYAADRVRNTGSIFLGMTLGCAECHDHKFDPFTQKDFYSFAAFFADVKETPVGRQPTAKLYTPEQEQQIQTLDKQISPLQAQVNKLTAELKKAPKEKKAELTAELKKAQQQLKPLQNRKNQIAKTARETLITTRMNPRTMRVLPRGNWLDDSGAVVLPSTPSELPKLTGVKGRASRMDLARWLTDEKNPMFSRVFVNRLWKITFGQGIVKTLDDFGSQGSWPTHPALLDWLAVEFREGGWDVKGILKLMVTSRAYRQSSKVSPELREKDPFNRLFARQSRYRLEAEMVRDNALAVSGLLSRQIGGRSVKPYQPAGYWVHLNFPRRTWKKDSGEDLYRRGVYTYWCRTFLHPSLLAFDAPSREECTVERPRSNTPQQALVLLNDPTYVEAARVLAARLMQKGEMSFAERLRQSYREVLQRDPKAEEERILQGLYERHLQQYQKDPKAAEELLSVGDSPTPTDLDAGSLAAWTSVTRVLLNLHETITRY